jgi:hypothetical protein
MQKSSVPENRSESKGVCEGILRISPQNPPAAPPFEAPKN